MVEAFFQIVGIGLLILLALYIIGIIADAL
jgi:hypothetical protein